MDGHSLILTIRKEFESEELAERLLEDSNLMERLRCELPLEPTPQRIGLTGVVLEDLVRHQMRGISCLYAEQPLLFLLGHCEMESTETDWSETLAILEKLEIQVEEGLAAALHRFCLPVSRLSDKDEFVDFSIGQCATIVRWLQYASKWGELDSYKSEIAAALTIWSSRVAIRSSK